MFFPFALKLLAQKLPTLQIKIKKINKNVYYFGIGM